jgi:hypothetical protein
VAIWNVRLTIMKLMEPRHFQPGASTPLAALILVAMVSSIRWTSACE